MGKVFEGVSTELAAWIAAQRVFFVATAPLAAGGRVNCSPKGLDSLRILGPREAAYLDLTGSGVETIAHLRENGRIVLMFCAFEGAPRIVRLHGRGEAVLPDAPGWPRLRAAFPELPGARAVIRIDLTRVSDSCGYGVPRLGFQGERDTLERWTLAKGEGGLRQYQAERNARSIDGLPGLEGA